VDDYLEVKRAKIGVFHQKWHGKQQNNTFFLCPCVGRRVWWAGVHWEVAIIVLFVGHMASCAGDGRAAYDILAMFLLLFLCI